MLARLFAGVFACLLPLSLSAATWTVESLAEALAERPAEDRARDTARQPAEVLVAAGIERGMTVMDLASSGGWYAEVLSVAVGDEGRVYAQNAPEFLEWDNRRYDKAITARLAGGRLANVQRIDAAIGNTGLAAGSLDAALTALNLHDYYYLDSEEVAVQFLSGVGNLLKPGGFVVIIDHHGAEGADNAALHRMTEDLARKVIEAAGLDIIASPQTLRRPDDDLTLMVFEPEIRGKTDRFVLVAARPTQ
ncbi:MAG: SAM-dependent methyltransferase [Gammaproteobacteria bacterium]|nr:SAM-dependent methyltransferase [Gammaproteobacteria bacterium]MDE0366383.1 SAM-dependent methyltransferase [Gammaproteobacteria bacterium]